MKTKLEDVRNVTISTKVSASEKTELQQIANNKNITRSELIYELLMGFKNHYDYIGRISPKEEKLSAELDKANRSLNKMSIELENAVFRIGMERKEIKRQSDEKIKLQKLNMKLKVEISKLKSENEYLHQQLTKHEKVLAEQDGNELNISFGTIVLGIISILAWPALVKK